MRDPVFSGRDVAEAVRTASRTLSVPEATLRYVVLDEGQVGGRGLSATEARIAVLIEKPGQPASRAPEGGAVERDERPLRDERRPRRSDRSEVVDDRWEVSPAVGIRELVQGWARGADCELAVELHESRDVLEVQIDGAGASALFDPQGETLAALEHVLERVCGRGLAPRRLRVRCAGYREYRDAVLRERAESLARQVVTDGEARTTEPLNSYERRIIHVALEAVPGVETYSVGEGSARRVTIAPRGQEGEAADDPASPAPEAPQPVGVTRTEAVQSAQGVESPAVKPEPPEPRPRQIDPPTLEWRQFDRPPQGGGDAGLM